MQNKTYITHRNVNKDGYLEYADGTIRNGWPEPFQFEIFDHQWTGRWIQDNWLLSTYVGIGYIVVIFGLQYWMKNRKPFDLKRELFLWNAAIGIFSFCGFYRMLPELLHVWSKPEGLYRSVCVIEGANIQTAFWGLLFTLSKFVELFDTVFIVLRKKPLVLLQWYHHFVTMVAAWLMLPYGEPIIVYLAVCNYGVHSMMYTYFALKALDVKIPKIIANFITSCQFAQMVIYFIVMTYSAFLYYTGVPCYRNPFSLKLGLAITISFNILFGELFYKSVIQKRKKKAE